MGCHRGQNWDFAASLGTHITSKVGLSRVRSRVVLIPILEKKQMPPCTPIRRSNRSRLYPDKATWLSLIVFFNQVSVIKNKSMSIDLQKTRISSILGVRDMTLAKRMLGTNIRLEVGSVTGVEFKGEMGPLTSILINFFSYNT